MSKFSLLMLLFLTPCLGNASGSLVPEELVPFVPNGMSDSPNELAGIPIHSKKACLGLLRPILSPEVVINAGLKALVNPAPSSLACLDSVVGTWEKNALLAENPFPNPIWEAREKNYFWRARKNYYEKLIRCFNPEKPGSAEYSVFEGMNATVCEGFWLSKNSYLKAKKGLDEAAEKLRLVSAEVWLREHFPQAVAGVIAKDETDKNALGPILANPSLSSMLPREKLFETYLALECAKLKKPASEEDAFAMDKAALCKERGLATEVPPDALEARLRAFIPDAKEFLTDWKKDLKQRSEIAQEKRTTRSKQLTFNYGLRRLLTNYAFAGKSKAGPPSLEDFCAENEASLRSLKDSANRIKEFKPFKNAEQWRLMADNGLNELEYSGINGYTGRYYSFINREIWGNLPPSADPALLEQVKQMTSALTAGLDRLPSYRGRPVKRFAELPENVLAEHQVGKIVTYGAFTSTSKKQDWAWGDGKSHKFLIYGGRNDKDVTALSANPFEEEVLFKAGTRFKVLSRKPKANGLYDFVLAEVDDAGNVIAKLPKPAKLRGK